MQRLSVLNNHLAGNEINKILLIGSGLMSETVIDYLLKCPKNHIQVASYLLEEAKKLISTKQRCTCAYLDARNESELRKLIQPVDIVIAYVPPEFIVPICKISVECAKSVVTSQYIFPELWALDKEAKQKGVIILNEIGLDPGIDHLATIQIKDEVEKKGGKIIEYESWCGGFPASDCCDNPFGYKFSWSPYAAIKNANNDAKYLENGKVTSINNRNLLYSRQIIKINPALVLEGYPNRDSVQYKELYKFNDCQKLIRGTLRYQGYAVLLAAMKSIGLIQNDEIKDIPAGTSFYDYLLTLVKNESEVSKKLPFYHIDTFVSQIESDLSKQQIEILLIKIFNRVFSHEYYANKGLSEILIDAQSLTECLNWLQFFNSKVKINLGEKTHAHNFAGYLYSKMQYKKNESDFVVMQHRFKVQYPNQSKIQNITSTLLMIGDKNGSTAMAKTVGIPTAIATQLILDKRITAIGCHMPNMKEINDPIIAELKKAGIEWVDEYN